MPKAAEELMSPSKKTTVAVVPNSPTKKVTKRKFDSLESFVRTLSSNRHPSLRVNPDAAKLIARMAEQTVLELAEGGADLMRWKNKSTATLQSRDVKTFIENSYPQELSEAMIAHSRKAERKFARAKKEKTVTSS
jgi:hypothetical protein